MLFKIQYRNFAQVHAASSPLENYPAAYGPSSRPRREHNQFPCEGEYATPTDEREREVEGRHVCAALAVQVALLPRGRHRQHFVSSGGRSLVLEGALRGRCIGDEG